MIVEYMLNIEERDGQKVGVTPAWVTNGGHFYDPDTKTMIGFCPALSNRNWYLPDTVVTYTLQQLQERNIALHARYPFKKLASPGQAEESMTNYEVSLVTQDVVEAYNVA